MRFLTAISLSFLILFGSLSVLGINLSQSNQVEILKKQAEGRKEFYREQARIKEELKASQQKERQLLLERHRVDRKKFSEGKHSAEERAAFFKGQRDEMMALRAREKAEKDRLEGELKKKILEFHAKQKEESATGRLR